MAEAGLSEALNEMKHLIQEVTDCFETFESTRWRHLLEKCMKILTLIW